MAQNSPSQAQGPKIAKVSKSLRAGRNTGTYVPPAEQGVMLGMRAAGMTKTRISQTLHRSQDTVRKILSKFESEELVLVSRSIVLEKAPQLAKKLAKLALGGRQALTDLLKGVQVLTPREERTETKERDPLAGRDYYELRFYGVHMRWPTPEEKEKFIADNSGLKKQIVPPVLLARNDSPGDD